MALKQGTCITFSYKNHELTGLVVQVKSGEANVKLSSGYNIIVPESDVKNSKVLSVGTAEKMSEKHVKQDTSLPRITILHLGGTIASKVDYKTGGVSTHFSDEELLGLFPEMLQLAKINSRFLRNMWSQDMRFPHYNIIAHAVIEEITNGAQGVIITQGTDFIGLTTAALSFALEGLNIPVMVVGAQRSSDRGSSDAAENVLGAIRFITQGKIPGVFSAMHETSDDRSTAIIDGLHVRKMHSSRRDAFVSVNAPLFARVKNGKTEILDKKRAAAWKARTKKKPRVVPFKEDLKIGLWKTHPQSFLEELSVYDTWDGLVVEGSGLGHGPTTPIDEFTKEHGLIQKRIGELAKKIPVVWTVQTIFGRVNLDVYANQRIIQDLGVLGNQLDMMPETAFIKLAWLLSNYKVAEAKRLFGENLRGEISERSNLEDTHTELN